MVHKEVDHQPTIVFDTNAELLTATRAVVDTEGPGHYLVDPTKAGENPLNEGHDAHRPTLTEQVQLIDWDKPTPVRLVGPEAEVVISALTRQARQPESWLQAQAADALETAGMGRRAKVSRGISHLRTVIHNIVTPQAEPTTTPLRELMTQSKANTSQAQEPQTIDVEEFDRMLAEEPTLVSLTTPQERANVIDKSPALRRILQERYAAQHPTASNHENMSKAA